MKEGGPDMSRRGFLGNAAKFAAGAMLVKAGVTGAEAQEAKIEMRESKVPSVEEITAITKRAIQEAREKKISTMEEGFITNLQKRILGGQDPAAGIATFDTGSMHLATPLQKNAYNAYESFKSQLDSYLDATQSAIALEGTNKDLLHEIHDPEKQKERAVSEVPSLVLASSAGFPIEDSTIRNAERMREAALALEAANRALLDQKNR